METQLAYRLRAITDEQRTGLLAKLGIAERTWRRWLKRPGALIPAEHLMTIKTFLDDIDQKDYNLAEMLKPVQILA